MKLLLSALLLMSSVSTFAASRECVLEAKAAGEAISKLNFPRTINSRTTRAVLLDKSITVPGIVDYVYDVMPGGDPMQSNFKVSISKDSGHCIIDSVKADANG